MVATIVSTCEGLPADEDLAVLHLEGSDAFQDRDDGTERDLALESPRNGTPTSPLRGWCVISCSSFPTMWVLSEPDS